MLTTSQDCVCRDVQNVTVTARVPYGLNGPTTTTATRPARLHIFFAPEFRVIKVPFNPHHAMSALVLHIPHASSSIPAAELEDFVVPTATLEHEKLRLIDHFTDELYMAPDFCYHHAAVAPVCRLVVDVERFDDDLREPASQVGMGAVYTTTTSGKPLRNITVARRQQLLELFYAPHHARLDSLVQGCLETTGRCVVLDCHSFPVEPLPTQTAFLEVSPEICIGTDPVHTPIGLRDLVVSHFTESGFEVLVDTPFCGSLVPNEAYKRKDTRVESVMVEVRRDLYMDESSGERNECFIRVQQTLTALREKLSRYAAAAAPPRDNS